MKKSTLSILSLLLALVMLLGILASCGGNNPQTDNSTESTGKNDAENGSDPGENTEKGNESETSNQGGEPGEDGPIIPPDLNKIDNGEFISHANSLMNGVNAYFTSGKRTDFVIENQNSKLEYALTAGKSQQITSLVNSKGNAYIQNTGDVFVKMIGGGKLYASNSTAAATANLYRFGYYMYEARFEEQNFLGAIDPEKYLSLNIASVERNDVTASYNKEEGSLHVTIDDDYDPFIKFRGVKYSAADYPYVALTMKANVKSARSMTAYLSTDSHSMGSATGAVISPSDEYLTYIIPLYRTDWYKGTVTGFRLDFNSIEGETYDIKEVKLIGGSTENIPEKLGLNRSFFIYSDKLHEVIQFASANIATENIESLGVETKLAKDTVLQVVVKDKNGIRNTFDGADWASAEYVGFDVKDAGIFGYILPAGDIVDKLEVIDDGESYVIIQSRTPENGTIQPSGVWNADKGAYDALVDNNANDLYMGHRIYTDETHSFDTFLQEAFLERNPLTKKNFVINERDSSYSCSYECPECGKIYQDSFARCENCENIVSAIEHPTLYFVGYNALRGLYSIYVPGESFSNPYFQYPNKYINATFVVKGDEYDREIYLMTESSVGCLECAVVLDENKMLLPIPVEVGKNFSEGFGERNLWNIQDNTYSEAIVPMKVSAKSDKIYTILNLYQNWGQYPLKQVSWIQFYAPYYHLSTGVTESNCIVPYYSCKNSRGLGTLPDHRAMSAHLWAGQPQHTSGGSHRWLMYTDADGKYSASENTLDYIDSYGPVYADVYMDYLSDDGKIKVSYTHMEFPQTDENRAYYEMKYEVLEDVSFNDFANDFCFYDVSDNDAKGSYINVGYLNENNESVIVDAAKGNESYKYVLGDNCPYFSFFNMPDYDVNSTSAEGFTNLSFLIHSYDIVINGQKSDAHFVIVNEDNRVRLSLDLGSVTLKKGDTIVINAIVMPWGDETLNYDEVGDKNVRDVRVNTLLNPLTPKAVESCEVLESVFLPKIKSTNGKNATFTLTGGQNNVAVRVYGFTTLTAPKIEELVDGEWVEYKVSSAWNPDRFGNAHYFDGYSVHYDPDGTFSYSFIVPMDYTDKDGRTFRVSAEEEFTSWPNRLPEIEGGGVELPLNVFVPANEIMIAAKAQAGKNFGNIAMSADSSYVTLSSNSSVAEAYFKIWLGDGGRTVTGQYFVLKYRLPDTNNKKHTYFEYFTKTEKNISDSQSCFGISNALISDNQWHTLVVDVSSWNKECFVASGDDYKAQFARIDLFNDNYADGNSIDIEFFGITDSLEEIVAYYSVDSIQLYTYGKSIVSYDKQLNEIETPTDIPVQGGGMQDAVSGVPGYNVYLNATALATSGKNTLWKDNVTMSGDGKYVTFKNYVTAASDDHKKESYFTFYSSTGSQATGQYAVIKYRANVQQGSITIWSSTENSGPKSGSSIDLYSPDDANGLFIADNQWHIVIVDLSQVISTFTATDSGKYAATHLRVDFFNFEKPRDPSDTQAQVDVAYIGICDDFTEILTSDKSVGEVVFYNGKTFKYSTATGEITSAPSDEPTPNPNPTPTPKPDSIFTQYFNATSIIEASQQGGGHAGKSELIDGKVARIYNCVDTKYNENLRKESYFSLFSGNTAETGRYLVIKYRAKHQVGYMQIYSSTVNASPSDGGNSFSLTLEKELFVANDQWHIVVLDLEKVLANYKPDDGKYFAKHLRIDLFNFGSPLNNADTAYVDIAYIGLSNDLEGIITNDMTVEKVSFYDGSLSEFSTSGETIETPNFIINAAALSKQTEKTGLTHAASSDGKYVTYTYSVGSSEGYAYVVYPGVGVNAPSAATGQYIMLKYRTTYKGDWQMYIGANNGSSSAAGGKDSFTLSQKNGSKGAIISDGEWQYLIIDASFLSEWNGFLPENDGTYMLDYYRIDFFNSKYDTAYTVDLEYVVIADSLAKLVNYGGMTSYTYVDTYSSGIINETVNVTPAK